MSSQMQRTDKYLEHSSIIWPIALVCYHYLLLAHFIWKQLADNMLFNILVLKFVYVSLFVET